MIINDLLYLYNSVNNILYGGNNNIMRIEQNQQPELSMMDKLLLQFNNNDNNDNNKNKVMKIDENNIDNSTKIDNSKKMNHSLIGL